MKKKEILVIVAHPDDETIWMGGTLLKSKFKKTVICLCRKNDKDRFPKFQKACKILNAKGYISDLDDFEKGYFKKISSQDIIKRILKFAKEKKYDYLFTHGKNGEYEHIRHKEIHNAVKEMLNKKILSVKKVFFFSYLPKKNNFQGYAKYNSSADKLIKLNFNELMMKKNIIKNIYCYSEGGFEEKSSDKIEAFDSLK
jgi:hydroxymethylpyrimidine pyrophosphatase-like HAD family hydrolase